jgi:hypothetical protein
MSTQPLSWRCPACQAPLQHDGDMSLSDQIYRCHACRLDLVLDARIGGLAPARSQEPPALLQPTGRTPSG